MRGELTEKLTMLASRYGVDDIQGFRDEVIIILDNYEVTNRCTEIAIPDEDFTDLIIKRFLTAKLIKGCTQRTIKFYRETITHFFEFVGKRPDMIVADDIRYYMAIRLRRDGISQVTLGNECRNLSTFFAWCHAEEVINKNPMNKIEPVKAMKTKKEAFTEMEIELLRGACYTNKERAILEVLLSTGCREMEMRSLKVEDVQSNGSIKVLGKGNKERYVYLNAKAELALKNYMAERKDTNPYLFPKMKKIMDMPKRPRRDKYRLYMYPESVDGMEMAEQSAINGQVKKLAKRAGVKDCHTHKFRRTCATFALRKGMPIEQVSKMLGHESIETTQIYLDLSENELEYSHHKYVY